jgi:uncharacterized protein YegP (UPF0339 family)
MPSRNMLLVLSILQACLVPNLLAAPSSVSATTQAQAIQKGTKASGRTLKFETYTDAKGESRWRLKSTNGQVIATSGQGYKDKRDCKNAINVIKEGAGSAKVEEAS